MLLSVAAAPLFLFTRSMAALNRERNARVAATWYELGQHQLQQGDARAAIASFRSAAVNNHDKPEYMLALAGALAAEERNEEARQTLLRLRDSSPEDPEINLELGRLAAKRGNVPEALLYYHHALYGLWTGELAERKRRQARLELIQFLIRHKEKNQALSETLILSQDLPQNAASHTEVGGLFLLAGDTERALEHFTQALRLDRKSAAALAGAGEAAFRLRDYARARRYLQGALEQDQKQERAAELLEIAKMVLSYDPLAARLTNDQRNERLLAGFAQSLERLQDCLDQPPSGGAPPRRDLETLRDEALTLKPKLQPKKLRGDPELLRTAMELIYQIEETTARSCGQPRGLDQALLLIGRKHGLAEP